MGFTLQIDGVAITMFSNSEHQAFSVAVSSCISNMDVDDTDILVKSVSIIDNKYWRRTCCSLLIRFTVTELISSSNAILGIRRMSPSSLYEAVGGSLNSCAKKQILAKNLKTEALAESASGLYNVYLSNPSIELVGYKLSDVDYSDDSLDWKSGNDTDDGK